MNLRFASSRCICACLHGAAALLLATACYGSGVAPARAAPASSGVSAPTVEALVGSARCDADAQCQTIGIGWKACGGPQSYLAWSTLATDAAALRAAAGREAEIARRKAEEAGAVSTCSVVSDPGAQCVGVAAASAASSAPGRGVCRLRPGSMSGGRVY